MRVEFGSKATFAAVAEALGVTVPEVFSVMPSDDDGRASTPSEATAIHVIYQPGVTKENVSTQPAYRALLIPDADGILRKVKGPVLIPDFFEKVSTRMSELLDSMKGDDDGNG